MGKKRVIKKTSEELIKEKDQVEQKLKKEVHFKGAGSLKRACVYVSSTYNNTLITVTNTKGDVLFWRSSGSIGFKGTKKGTSFAGSKVAEAIADGCKKLNINQLEIYLKGIGSGRASALRTLASRGFEIVLIKDITPLPHNGCRPRKPRRV